MVSRRSTFALAFVGSLFAAGISNAGINVYISGPNTQEVTPGDFSSIEGVEFKVENFNGLSEGDFPGTHESANGGTYSYSNNASNNDIEILPADEWGGTYSGPGTPGAGANESYLVIGLPTGSNGSLTITFDIPIAYFGFFWTAGNPSNRITLYDINDNSLGTFDTTTLTELLSPPSATLTALGGAEYTASQFYGQPASGLTTADDEPFAFLHFIDNLGENSIAKIIMEHTEGGGFESDNHTTSVIAPGTYQAPNLILVQEVVPDAVPEPSTFALIGFGAAAAFWLRNKHRKVA